MTLRTGLARILGVALMLGCSSQAEPGGTEEALGDDAVAGMRCPTRPLADACGSGNCPASPEDVPIECPPDTAHRYETECGGSVVVVARGLGATNWYFDAEGNLVGRTSMNDRPSPCGDGTQGFSHVFGEMCLAQGEGIDLCVRADEPPNGDDDLAETCPPLPLDELCENQPCPATPDDVTPLCGYGSTRSATECGGAVVVTTTLAVTTGWYFDAEGRLIGATLNGDLPVACEDGSQSTTRTYGVSCEAQGDAVNLCL